MIPNELSGDLIALADSLFDTMTNDEATVVRLYADGENYDQIAELLHSTASSVKSAMYRACNRLEVKPARMGYLVGIHDARAHIKAMREEEVHVIITRGGIITRVDV